MNNQSAIYMIHSVISEPTWNTIPQLEINHILWRPDCGIRAFGQFCHSAEALHVHLCAVEKNIRAEYTVPLSPVCLEVLLIVCSCRAMPADMCKKDSASASAAALSLKWK